MLFAKTFCNPGSYVEIAPAGLLATLQYNSHGLIEKIYYGFDTETTFDIQLFNAAKSFIPRAIPLTGGTTYVKGVFYNGSVPLACEGTVPECYEDTYCDMILSGDRFEFCAGLVESKASNFQGALVIRNWLSLAGFTPVAGLIAPAHFNDLTLQNMIKANCKQLAYPYIAGFFVFDNLSVKYIPAGLKQIVVKRVQDEMDTNGYLHCRLHSDTDSIHISYSDYIHKDIQEGTSVLFSDDVGIEIATVQTNSDGKHRIPLKSEKECPICHKVYRVPASGVTICNDPNCLSRCYPRVTKMLNTLNLPKLSYSTYIEKVKDHTITMFTDVLLLPGYKDLSINATLSQALEAATPSDVCRSPDFFIKFANSCNDSVETALYYMQNPLRISADLNIQSIALHTFVQWIACPENLLAVQTLLGSVHIVPNAVLFNCAPVFRGKAIVITGKFIRGDYKRIHDILESCAATVSDSIGDKVPDYVVTGGTYENINGELIQGARLLGIPVIDESTFFEYFDLDADIAKNLL